MKRLFWLLSSIALLLVVSCDNETNEAKDDVDIGNSDEDMSSNTCTVNGKVYQAGEFSHRGCNSCECDPSGLEYSCTTSDCGPGYDQEEDLNDADLPDALTDTEQPDAVAIGPDDVGTMVDVPAGKFLMGCNEEVDTACYLNENPHHELTLSTYRIGKYEVSVGEYQKCITNGACNNTGDIHYRTNTDDPECNLGVAGKEKHPMQCVTWYGAKAYCEYIGKRLPSEAEWEKAARGPDGGIYPWGNDPDIHCEYVVKADGNEGLGCGVGGPMTVGSKPNGISLYGAYDMIGNVWEWVNDWYDDDYYETMPTKNPAGPGSGAYRVLRGGSWRSGVPSTLRASYRSSDYPESSSSTYGFRCAE